VAAAPLCRAVSITVDPRRARLVGAATAVVDAVGVALVLAANDVDTQRRAALANASIDLAGAAALAGLAARNEPGKRLVSIAASAFLVLGATAWLRGARQLRS
jgi:hypothetical protein